MKKKMSLLLAISFLTVCVFNNKLPAKAAGYEEWAPVFNPEYYMTNNPNASAYAQGDINKLLEYYLQYGIANGDQASEEFNVYIYALNNPDIAAVFTSNFLGYYLHYIQCGKAEGRNARTLLTDTNSTSQNVAEETKPVGTLNVKYRTQQQIKDYMGSHPTTNTVTYTTPPVFQGEQTAMGWPTLATFQDGLNAVNVVRFIAGLDEVTLNDNYNYLCQAACLVNAANGQMTHYPTKPSNVDEELYQKGSEGASSSNLGWNYSSLSSVVYKGWMYDGDDKNISRMGHRRWVLNPTMKQTGFGIVGQHTAMYSFDNYRKNTNIQVAWPAQNMPVSLMSYYLPWTVSLVESVNAESVKVVLTDMNKCIAWNFYQGTNDGYFNVDNQRYGRPGCIIFRPAGRMNYNSGDVFNVVITGKYNNGNSFSVYYDVKIF